MQYVLYEHCRKLVAKGIYVSQSTANGLRLGEGGVFCTNAR